MPTFPDAIKIADPEALQLEGLFSSARLAIPDYQRELAWTEEQGEELFADVFETASTNIPLAPKQYECHFLGPVVTSPGTSGRSQVIDGQQRLTYLTVLLTALQTVAESVDAAQTGFGWKQEVQAAVEFSRAGKRELRLLPPDGPIRSDLYQLVIGCKDRDERESHLAGMPDGNRSARGRLANAFRAAYQYIDGYLSVHTGQPLDASRTLLETALYCLTVIDVKVPNPDRAFDVFERLNARGLPLGQADLVKNLLLKFAHGQSSSASVKKQWDVFIGHVDSTSGNWLSPSDFLQLIYMSTWGHVRGSDLLGPYRDLLTGASSISAASLTQYIAEQASMLRELVDAPSAWTTPNQSLCALLRTHLANKFSLALALAARSRYDGNSPDFRWVLVLTHSYVFRRFVLAEVGLAKYGELIGEFSRRLRWGNPKPPKNIGAQDPNDGPTLAGPTDLAKEMTKQTTDAELTQNLVKYRPRSAKLGFYIAYMLEIGAARQANKNAFGGKTPDLQSSSQHLEHILPKNAHKAPGWAGLKLSAQDSRTISSMWGNLIILPGRVNSSIKDKDFASKRTVYQSGRCAALELPKSIPSGGGTWNEKSIQKREASVAAATALLAWPFPATLPSV